MDPFHETTLFWREPHTARGKVYLSVPLPSSLLGNFATSFLSFQTRGTRKIIIGLVWVEGCFSINHVVLLALPRFGWVDTRPSSKWKTH